MKQNGYEFQVVGNKYIGKSPDGTTFDTGIDATNHTPIEVAEITSKAAQKRVETEVAGRKDVANIGATVKRKYK